MRPKVRNPQHLFQEHKVLIHAADRVTCNPKTTPYWKISSDVRARISYLLQPFMNAHPSNSIYYESEQVCGIDVPILSGRCYQWGGHEVIDSPDTKKYCQHARARQQQFRCEYRDDTLCITRRTQHAIWICKSQTDQYDALLNFVRHQPALATCIIRIEYVTQDLKITFATFEEQVSQCHGLLKYQRQWCLLFPSTD